MGRYVKGMVIGALLGPFAFALLLWFAVSGEASPGFVIFLFFLLISFTLAGGVFGLLGVAMANLVVFLLVRLNVLSKDRPPYCY